MYMSVTLSSKPLSSLFRRFKNYYILRKIHFLFNRFTNSYFLHSYPRLHSDCDLCVPEL